MTKAIDVGGLHDDPARIREVEALIAAMLAQLAASYPQLASNAKQRQAAKELVTALSRIAAEREPCMGELVAGLRSVHIRGLGHVNALWPRLFFTERGRPEPLDIGGRGSVQLAHSLHDLLAGYIGGDESSFDRVVASLVAARPTSLAALHSLLCEADATLPDFETFEKAWRLQFNFDAAKLREPDWRRYWEHERQTAYGGRYPTSIIEFLSAFLRGVASREPQSRILDIGTGNHGATALASAVDGRFDLYGIDRAPPPVSIVPRLKVARMDANRLAFSEGVFDAAMSVNGIEYADPDQALPELRRVLASGAEVALVLHRPGSVVVRRAIEMNSFLREARILETLALAALHLMRPSARLHSMIEERLHVLERRHDVPPDPFFTQLWPVVREGLRATPASVEATLAAVQWSDEFLRWVLQKNDYVVHHASQLGADPGRLAQALRTHGMEMTRAVTLGSEPRESEGIAALGVLVRAR